MTAWLQALQTWWNGANPLPPPDPEIHAMRVHYQIHAACQSYRLHAHYLEQKQPEMSRAALLLCAQRFQHALQLDPHATNAGWFEA